MAMLFSTDYVMFKIWKWPHDLKITDPFADAPIQSHQHNWPLHVTKNHAAKAPLQKKKMKSVSLQLSQLVDCDDSSVGSDMTYWEHECL